MKKVTQTIQKVLLLAFFSCVAVLGAFAAEEKECIVVYLQSDEIVSYFLEDTPVVTYVETNVHIESAELQADYPMAEVVKCTFEKKEKIETSVRDTESRITVNDNIVRIQGLSAGVKVMLSDIQGRVISIETIGASGEIVLPLDNLNAGVYVVATSEGRSFKVLKH